MAEKKIHRAESREKKPTILISKNKWTATSKPVVFRVINLVANWSGHG